MVHWAATADEAGRIVIEHLSRCAAPSASRESKSMLGEEIGLPHALAEAGIERVETDLAEHIVQLGGDTPSHIIWPAMHRTREQVSEMFRKAHSNPARARRPSRPWSRARGASCATSSFAPMLAISGANFLVADTGATCTVTNEGNAELTTTPPRVHIVTAGIEKLVPSTAHAFAMLRLLVRSATGGDITQYTTFHCGPKRPGDRDGPEEFHIVLVDNGRYADAGGGLKRHAALHSLRRLHEPLRGLPPDRRARLRRRLSGPDGRGADAGLRGARRKPRDLPHACTLNGRCQEVCPVDIPLPTLLRGWRDRCWREGLEPVSMRAGLGLWAFVAGHPQLYRLASAVAVRVMRLFARGGWIRSMPLASAWTAHRDLPTPSRKTFMELYKEGQRSQGR